MLESRNNSLIVKPMHQIGLSGTVCSKNEEYLANAQRDFQVAGSGSWNRQVER
jgi:hypothetical protein